MSFVLDKSGSMEGNKWAKLLKAIPKFIDNLESKDIIQGYVFNTKVNLLTEKQSSPTAYKYCGKQ